MAIGKKLVASLGQGGRGGSLSGAIAEWRVSGCARGYVI